MRSRASSSVWALSRTVTWTSGPSDSSRRAIGANSSGCDEFGRAVYDSPFAPGALGNGDPDQLIVHGGDNADELFGGPTRAAGSPNGVLLPSRPVGILIVLAVRLTVPLIIFKRPLLGGVLSCWLLRTESAWFEYLNCLSPLSGVSK